jgi:hypothetical protein
VSIDFTVPRDVADLAERTASSGERDVAASPGVDLDRLRARLAGPLGCTAGAGLQETLWPNPGPEVGS